MVHTRTSRQSSARGLRYNRIGGVKRVKVRCARATLPIFPFHSTLSDVNVLFSLSCRENYFVSTYTTATDDHVRQCRPFIVPRGHGSVRRLHRRYRRSVDGIAWRVEIESATTSAQSNRSGHATSEQSERRIRRSGRWHIEASLDATDVCRRALPATRRAHLLLPQESRVRLPASHGRLRRGGRARARAAITARRQLHLRLRL